MLLPFFIMQSCISRDKINMRANGTIRENRIAKCLLKTKNVLNKEKRRSYDFSFDE